MFILQYISYALIVEVSLYVWVLNSFSVFGKGGVQQEFQGFLAVQVPTSV